MPAAPQPGEGASASDAAPDAGETRGSATTALRGRLLDVFLITLVGGVVRVALLNYMARENGDNLWGLLTKWDAAQYLTIATEGYVQDDKFAFFPAFPMLMRLTGALGLDPTVGGMILNVGFLMLMCLGAMELARRMGAGYRGQLATAILVACAPMSIVFNMTYTEPLFGALTFWALVAMHDRQWVRAGVLVFLLGFVRLTAVDVIATFAVWVLLYGRKDWRAWVALVLSPLSLIGFITWVNMHLPKGYFQLQKDGWGSSFDMGKSTLEYLKHTIVKNSDVQYLITSAAIVGVVFALVYAWRRMPAVVWVFVFMLAANILLSSGIMSSRPRLLLPAIIVYMPLFVQLVEGRWGRDHPLKAWAVVALWALVGAWISAYMLAIFEYAI